MGNSSTKEKRDFTSLAVRSAHLTRRKMHVFKTFVVNRNDGSTIVIHCYKLKTILFTSIFITRWFSGGMWNVFVTKETIYLCWRFAHFIMQLTARHTSVKHLEKFQPKTRKIRLVGYRVSQKLLSPIFVFWISGKYYCIFLLQRKQLY